MIWLKSLNFPGNINDYELDLPILSMSTVCVRFANAEKDGSLLGNILSY